MSDGRGRGSPRVRGKDDDSPEMEELKRTNMALKNEELEIGNRAKKSELVPLSELKSIVYRIGTEAKVQFESIPALFKRRFTADASEEMLTFLEETCGDAAEAIAKSARKD